MSGIGNSFATVAGAVTAPGSKAIIERGVCWAVGKTPTVEDNCVKAAGDNFTLSLKSLPAESNIICRAYAISLAGVGYGAEKSFTTLKPTAPVVETVSVIPDDFSDEVNVYFIAKGHMSDLGGVEVTEAGVCYSTTPNPTVDSDKVKGYVAGQDFSVSLALAPKTKYYIRAYAVNNVGTSYGNEIELTTDEIVVPEYEHNVYYCDPNGNDATADGSEGKPFYSLQRR